MATPFRAALAQAVVDRLAATIPDARPERGRRAEVGEADRPLIAVTTGEATADDSFAAGEVLWTVDVTVAAHLAATRNPRGGLTAASADVAAEDAAAALEAQIIAALDGQALERPDGGALTTGLAITRSDLDVIPVQQSAARLADLTLTFRAQLLLPSGTATL